MLHLSRNKKPIGLENVEFAHCVKRARISSLGFRMGFWGRTIRGSRGFGCSRAFKAFCVV